MATGSTHHHSVSPPGSAITMGAPYRYAPVADPDPGLSAQGELSWPGGTAASGRGPACPRGRPPVVPVAIAQRVGSVRAVCQGHCPAPITAPIERSVMPGQPQKPDHPEHPEHPHDPKPPPGPPPGPPNPPRPPKDRPVG